MRYAFAGTGNDVDQHFGHAKYWQIYDVENGSGVFVETRLAIAKHGDNCDGGFEHIADVLTDCDSVFVNRIGPSAAAFMLSRGKRVFEAAGGIDDIIAQLARDDTVAGTD